MIIAKNGFRDEELFITKEILENKGYIIDIASSPKGLCRGMLGHKINSNLSLADVDVSNYVAVIFVGGSGAQIYWNNPLAHKIAEQAYKNAKVLGAICIAPVTLARAGILKGKKATVWAGVRRQIQKEGAIYTAKGVERDGNIVTADGPGSAPAFGYKLLEVLREKNK